MTTSSISIFSNLVDNLQNKLVRIEVIFDSRTVDHRGDDILGELPEEYARVPFYSTKEEFINDLSSFLLVMRHGGFPGDKNIECLDSIGNIDFNEIENGLLVASFEVKNVDLRAWNILKNIVDHNEYAYRGVRGVRVYNAGQSGLDQQTEHHGVSGYPDIINVVPFELQFENPWDYRGMRKVSIWFGSRISEVHLGCLEERVAAWSQLIEHSGFTDDPDALSTVDELDILGNDLCEIVVPHFEASEDAWNTLVNLMANFSMCVSMVKRLEII